MMDHDAQAICGPRHARGHERRAHRWGKTKGKIGFHGGKVEIERPRLRSFEGKEQALPSWEAAISEDWLGKWAMNQMLINVSTRKFARSVRLPEGDVPAPAGAGLSKSAASRRFVALSAVRMKEWMASDLSSLDLLVIQIDGIHIGAKALSKAIRRTFGRAAAIQRCQVHKARNIMERLPKSLHASVRRVLRQAWELDDADKAEKLIRNLAQRLERDWSGVSGSILEGIDEILTVTRLGLPKELRRSLACTNIIENVMGTVRRVCRNVKRWRSAFMALRWTAAAMQEAVKGFRRLKAHKQLPALRAALEARQTNNSTRGVLARQANAA
jgi:putative transposase